MSTKKAILYDLCNRRFGSSRSWAIPSLSLWKTSFIGLAWSFPRHASWHYHRLGSRRTHSQISIWQRCALLSAIFMLCPVLWLLHKSIRAIPVILKLWVNGDIGEIMNIGVVLLCDKLFTHIVKGNYLHPPNSQFCAITIYKAGFIAPWNKLQEWELWPRTIETIEWTLLILRNRLIGLETCVGMK